MTPPLRLAIVGGGTAGWMAANLLAQRWQDQPIRITLVESPDIGIIGVGEGSTPSLKKFFEVLDIAEAEWMPACHATYKANIRFSGWSPASRAMVRVNGSVDSNRSVGTAIARSQGSQCPQSS